MVEKQEKQWTCEHCGQDFETEAALKSHIRNKHKEEGVKALVKASPLDLAVQKLRVPMVPEEFNGNANIYWSGFNEGVTYGANSVLAGIRSAQELSSLGIAQATPIIKMAQEMRQAEGQAAQVIAGELAQATLQSNREIISAIKSQTIASSPNPMLTMMTEAMQPLFSQALGGLMGMFLPKPGEPQPGASEQPVSHQQETEQHPSQQKYQQAPIDGPPIEKHSRDEWRED